MNGIRNTISAVGEIGKELVTQVGLQVSSDILQDTVLGFCDLEDKHEDLMRERDFLCAIRNDIEREVRRCREKDTTDSCFSWITEASQLDDKVEDLVNKYEQMQKSNHVWRRSSLSSEIVKMIGAIKQLVKKRSSIMAFQVDKPLERVLKVLNAPHIASYPTLQSALEKVLELVRNSKIKAIGVHGLKGVGKTAIVQNLNNHDEVANLFDIVIFLGVSDDDESCLELQQKIARRLKVDTKGMDDSNDVARKIYEELKNKKYLLFSH